MGDKGNPNSAVIFVKYLNVICRISREGTIRQEKMLLSRATSSCIWGTTHSLSQCSIFLSLWFSLRLGLHLAWEERLAEGDALKPEGDGKGFEKGEEEREGSQERALLEGGRWRRRCGKTDFCVWDDCIQLGIY